MSLSTPTQIDVPFADLGTRTAIPAAANNTTGRAGYDLGFPPINSTPKVAGGIPPFGSDMNGILYDITVAEQFIQAGGSWSYDSAFATEIGGYTVGALVQRADRSGFWRNTSDGNTTDPDAGGANWQPEEAGATTVAMSSSNVTLTALQAARSIIIITGTLTANLNLVFPNYAKTWTVINSATGAFSVTCKTASGAGVAIPTGNTASVVGNGSTGIVSGFTALRSASGYQRLPSGVILQWGNTTSSGTSAGNATITFPIAFPTTCFCLLATPTGVGALQSITIQVGAVTTTSGQMTTLANGAISSGIGLYYFAVGV